MVLQFNATLSSCVSQVEVDGVASQPGAHMDDARHDQHRSRARRWGGAVERVAGHDRHCGGRVRATTRAAPLASRGGESDGHHPSCRSHAAARSTSTASRSSGLDRSACNPRWHWTCTSVAYEIANDANCTGTGCHGSVRGVRDHRTPDGGTSAQACTRRPASSRAATSAPPAAPQAGTAATLQTSDDRFLSAVWLSNTLWVAGNTGCTPSGDTQAALVSQRRHDRGDARREPSGAPPQLPVEGVSGAYLYNPALALDNAGDAIRHLRQVVELDARIDDGRYHHRGHVEQLHHAAHERDLLQPGQLHELSAGATTPRRCRTRRIRPTCGSSPRDVDGNTVNATCANGEHLLEHLHRAIYVCGTGDLVAVAGAGPWHRVARSSLSTGSDFAPGTHVHVQRRAGHDRAT